MTYKSSRELREEREALRDEHPGSYSRARARDDRVREITAELRHREDLEEQERIEEERMTRLVESRARARQEAEEAAEYDRLETLAAERAEIERDGYDDRGEPNTPATEEDGE